MKTGTTYSAILGSIIKQLRDQRSINQGEMAEMMELTQAAWSKLESGKSTLSTSQLAKAAFQLNVSAHEIVELADRATNNLQGEGMVVTYDNKEAESSGLMLLGAAAIGAIVALLLSKK